MKRKHIFSRINSKAFYSPIILYTQLISYTYSNTNYIKMNSHIHIFKWSLIISVTLPYGKKANT